MIEQSHPIIVERLNILKMELEVQNIIKVIQNKQIARISKTSFG